MKNERKNDNNKKYIDITINEILHQQIKMTEKREEQRYSNLMECFMMKMIVYLAGLFD